MKTIKTSTKLLALTGLLIGLALSAVGQAKADTGICPASASDLGADSVTITVPATTKYTVWTRMKAPDTSHNTINLEVDHANCFTDIGGGDFVAPTWTADSANWVNYSGGAPSNVISIDLAAGPHTFTYIGSKGTVQVDRIIVASDASCVPVGTGKTDANGKQCDSGDSTPPTVSLIAPTAGQGKILGTLNMAATATDQSGIAQVNFLVDGAVVGSALASPYSYAWNSAAATNADHTFSVQAIDKSGNSASTERITLPVSNAVVCNGNPSLPANVHIASISAASVNLAWDTGSAAAGCTLQSYKVYRNGVLASTVVKAQGTTFKDVGLTPSTTYSYTIEAVDTSKHTSARTSSVSATTKPDTTVPTPPTNLIKTLATSTRIALSWKPSIDNVDIKQYVVHQDFPALDGETKIDATSEPAITLRGLRPNTQYTFSVRARDSAGNVSPSSALVSATTLAALPANRGDLNKDGKVNTADLSILSKHWGQTDGPVAEGDINDDGVVNTDDVSIMLRYWGK